MKRRYLYEDYKRLYQQLEQRVPQIVIATDVIVGFPGESDQDFQETIQCLQDLKFQIVNVTQYYTRENTLAAKMPQINDQIKKQRSLLSSQTAVQCFNREQYVGQTMNVIVSEVLQYLEGEGFRNKRPFGAKSVNYLSVLLQLEYKSEKKEEIIEELKGRGVYIGAVLKVKITGASRVALVGEVLFE